ncbi:MAG: hypothetical protein COA54_04675 [Thiotrichaceae bacterium]|nr:MAG: hypothetical protein COA54_04675 [Thiotrichaceae bacterium]
MNNSLKLIIKRASIVVGALLMASCIMETVESPSSVRFSDTTVVSVQNSNSSILVGSTFAWLPDAVHFYKDERIQDAKIKPLIQEEIINNLRSKKMLLVESVNGASYAIGYTAALESSLNDESIIRRYGLLPGNSQIPQDDANVEKGSLIIYVFNTRTDEIVWRSAAQVGVKFDMELAKRKQQIKRVVAEMFQTLPVSN